jgi:hypothetical protein
MNSRPLYTSEIAVARTMFQDTIPYNKISITDGLGIGGRPYTIPVPDAAGIAGLVFFGPLGAAFLNGRNCGFQVNLGPFGFWGGANAGPLAPTLIHELTHVWQGYNSWWPLAYIFNSVWHQACQGAAAYDFVLGQEWGTYNVEQQASIVAYLFDFRSMTKAGSMSYRQWFNKYIVQHIWARRP